MCIILGVRQAAGHVVDARRVSDLSRATARFALDGMRLHVAANVGMAYQAVHTHRRSTLQNQPFIDREGNILAFDGRLDNIEELKGLVGLHGEASDGEIILATFAKYGDRCFARFIGDWSLSLWSRRDQSLYLARDHAGTRTLFYSHEDGEVLWSTALETFFTEYRARTLSRIFAHRYLQGAAIGSWTPYEGIRAVRPAHFLKFQGAQIKEIPHWDWMRTERRHYREESEYDEEFLSLFRRSIERRTTPWPGVIAQLSGGMDSTSIVCISDALSREQHSSNPELLETLSYFNDSDPNWNERPYFELIERNRGKTGTHFDVSNREDWLELPDPRFLLPGASGSSLRGERALEEALGHQRCRVMISGIGGDELLGGVPNPDPELAEYLVHARFASFLRQSLQWSLASRQPIYRIWKNAVHVLLPWGHRYTANLQPVPWLVPYKGIRHELADEDLKIGYRRGTVFPAATDAGRSWWSILETQPHLFPAAETRYEYRYPMLDRDLVEFLMAVPPEQLVRPGRRRFLMRRALHGILPEQILERRRKAYALHSSLSEISKKKSVIRKRLSSASIRALPFVHQDQLLKSLDEFERNDVALCRPLTKTISFALWLEVSMAQGRLSL